MNREIKFRAWDKVEKKMTPVWSVLSRWPIFPEDAKTTFEVMQFTGLKDKNGTEIYESDIVKGERYVHEVRFGTECIDASDYEQYCVETTGFYLTNYLGNKNEYEGLGVGMELEVIGNIYENPELLKL